MRRVLLLALLGLAACSSGRELAMPRGEWFALNEGRWQPTAEDLRGPEGMR